MNWKSAAANCIAAAFGKQVSHCICLEGNRSAVALDGRAKLYTSSVMGLSISFSSSWPDSNLMAFSIATANGSPYAKYL